MHNSFIDLIINDMGFIVAVIAMFLAVIILYLIISRNRKVSEYKRKKVMMAFVGGIIFLISALILIIFMWLATNPATKPDSFDIEMDGIEKIIAITQFTDSSPTEINIPEEFWEEFIAKLNSLSIEKIDSENMNGWQYLFKIKYSDESTLQIIFMNEKVKIGDSYYRVIDYNADDLTYVFSF
ncbi:MAG: hypothetical protein CSB16_01905 [Clostridiales bacterium]|nr:MAG: hypothetical protein CSB16_01905 [Clostridiales bacterium]